MGRLSSKFPSLPTLDALFLLAGAAWGVSNTTGIQEALVSPMTALREAFQQAGTPREPELLGEWILIRNVATDEFVNGGHGPDYVEFNAEGLRREDAGNRVEWTLSFARGGDGKLRARSDTVWVPSGDISPVVFTTEGDILFEKEYGGDSSWIYRCRVSNSVQLVCLSKDHENGHGLEFRKVAAAGRPRR